VDAKTVMAGPERRIAGGAWPRALTRLVLGAALALNWLAAGSFSDSRIPMVAPAETVRLEPAGPATPFVALRDGATLALRESGGRGAGPAPGADAATVVAVLPPIPERTAMGGIAAPARGPSAVLARIYDPRGPPATA
jgi:hypothetical protein